MTIAAIVLGHSHMSSVVNCLVHRPGEHASPLRKIEYYPFNTIRWGVDFHFSESAADSVVISNRLREIIDDTIPPDRERIYISMFGGNAHNALTLMEMDERLDVVLPFEPDLPLLPGRRVLTFDALSEYITYIVRHHALDIAVLAHDLTEPVFHFESPPPIADNAYVATNLEKYFKDQGDRAIAPALLRYKLWRIHSNIIERVCQTSGVRFLKVPAEATVEGRWLPPEGYSGDSTHAGPWYGLKLLRQLEQELGVAYGGWSWL